MSAAPAPKVGIIDYGSGNLRSVANALNRCGCQPEVFQEAAKAGQFDALVLPGVGSFGDCMTNLQNSRLDSLVKDWISSDKPFLGICVGYQLLFERSAESEGPAGLGVFEGAVVRFPSHVGKIPQMGWNTIETTPGDLLYQGVAHPAHVYFVHSYYPEPKDTKLVNAWCDYGLRFAAGIHYGRLFATQFHPEKSQATGLKILGNFINTI